MFINMKNNRINKLIGDKINGDLSDEDYIYDELKSISNADIEKISKQIDRLFESSLKEEVDISSYLLKMEKSLHGRDLKTYFNIIKKYGWEEERPGDGMNKKGQGWNTWIKSLSNKEKENLIDEIEFNLLEESALKEEIEDDSFDSDISDKLIVSLKKSGKLSPNTTLKQFSDALNRNPIYKSLIKRISSGSTNMKVMLPFYILIDTISDLELLSLDYKESTENIDKLIEEYIKDQKDGFRKNIKNINLVLDAKDKRLKDLYSSILRANDKSLIKKMEDLFNSYRASDFKSVLNLMHGTKQVIYSKLIELTRKAFFGEATINEGKIISGANYDHVKDQKINKIFKNTADLMDDIEENLSAELSNNMLKIEIIIDEFEADQLCDVDLTTGKVVKSYTNHIKIGTNLLK